MSTATIIFSVLVVVGFFFWAAYLVYKLDQDGKASTETGREARESQEHARKHVEPPPSRNRREDSSGDESIRLLRQIEKNTSATHFWTRVTGIPVLLGIIAGFLMALEKCN